MNTNNENRPAENAGEVELTQNDVVARIRGLVGNDVVLLPIPSKKVRGPASSKDVEGEPRRTSQNPRVSMKYEILDTGREGYFMLHRTRLSFGVPFSLTPCSRRLTP